MTSSSHISMHNDHRLWESEISVWRDDLRRWQRDVQLALDETQQLESALKSHGEALRAHASSLRLEEIDFSGHEHEIAEYEKGGQGGQLVPLAKEHRTTAAEHANRRKTHEQFKQRHHQVIAHWRLLLRSIRELTAAPDAEQPKAVVVES